jgi:hypothetical protein
MIIMMKKFFFTKLSHSEDLEFIIIAYTEKAKMSYLLAKNSELEEYT